MSNTQITVEWMRRWLSEQLAEEDTALEAVTTAEESIRVAYRVAPDRDLAEPFGFTGTEGTVATAYSTVVEDADFWTPPRFHAVALPAAGQEGVLWTLTAEWVHDIGVGEEWSEEKAHRLLKRADQTLQGWAPDAGRD